MINLNQYPIFQNHWSSLKETSKDNRDGKVVYMTESNYPVINFDEVKEEYMKALALCELPKSNDALFYEGDKIWVFVEFKNARVSKTLQYELRKKIYDSVLIFTDITSTGISFMRNHMKYILVYNEEANKDNSQDLNLIKKQSEFVQQSKAYDDLAKTIMNYGKNEIICFGLKIFLNYCFKEVHTFTKHEFEQYLSIIGYKDNTSF